MDERDVLCEALRKVNASLPFLVLIVFATLLSLGTVVFQKGQLCRTLEGGDVSGEPPVYPIKRAAGAIIVGALGFFLCLALDTLGKARAGDDPVARRSAQVNVLASLLVLAAAILRLDDIEAVEHSRQSALLEEDVLPD